MPRKKLTKTTYYISALNFLKRAVVKLFFGRISYVGLTIGLYFMVLSLTPSLMPRTWLFQGLVSGLSLISGYTVGVFGMWIWSYLGIKQLSGSIRQYAIAATVAGNVVLLAWIMTKAGDWQNRVRELVGIEPSSTTNPIRIVVVAVILAVVVLAIGRVISYITRKSIHFYARFVPQRVAVVVGIGLSLWFFGSIVSGAFATSMLRLANNTFSIADKTTVEGSIKPTSTMTSGSPESLVTWQELGKQGRRFAGSGPSQSDIQSIWPDARQPIRAYAGLESGETHEQRAQVVLQELIRTDAFERSKLLIATTTGTGYLDPNAVNTFEYVNQGDTAIAGMQYSYLPSWLALLSDTETAKDAGVALFNEIHTYWQDLEESDRPELYLYGLSLGAYGSQASISRVELLNDPVDGALWAGPPFVSEFWNRITMDRDPGSPAWLPEYQNGRVIRFTDGITGLDEPTAQWQDNKIIYLQYPTDPVVFFSTDYMLHEPEWLQGETGYGVTKDMRWYPFVTFWQLAFDLVNAGSTAEGYGHLYSPDDYIDSWVALTQPSFSQTEIDSVKQVFID